jgi:hypothetical protein
MPEMQSFIAAIATQKTNRLFHDTKNQMPRDDKFISMTASRLHFPANSAEIPHISNANSTQTSVCNALPQKPCIKGFLFYQHPILFLYHI